MANLVKFLVLAAAAGCLFARTDARASFQTDAMLGQQSGVHEKCLDKVQTHLKSISASQYPQVAKMLDDVQARYGGFNKIKENDAQEPEYRNILREYKKKGVEGCPKFIEKIDQLKNIPCWAQWFEGTDDAIKVITEGDADVERTIEAYWNCGVISGEKKHATLFSDMSANSVYDDDDDDDDALDGYDYDYDYCY